MCWKFSQTLSRWIDSLIQMNFNSVFLIMEENLMSNLIHNVCHKQTAFQT